MRYSLQAGESIDHYQILNPIGIGAAGEVYRVQDTLLNRTVSLKLSRRTDARSEKAFRQEIEMLATITHPNIITVLAAGVWQDRPYFITECLTPLPQDPDAETALQWILAICSAIETLVAKGIIHRDIKPNNILWRPETQTPILIDFGVAIYANQAQDYGAGTLNYSAPEQFLQEATPISDIYAIGKLIQALIPKNTYLATPWKEILLKTLSTDPNLRYAAVPDLVKDLVHCAKSYREQRAKARRHKIYRILITIYTLLLLASHLVEALSK